MKVPRVILSGGGTGGHIFPAISIANEIKKMVPEAEVLFVGALGRMEMEKVPAAGYNIVGIPIAGIQRKLTWKNLKLPWLVIQSMLRSFRIIRDFRPDVVVGTGGYASGPVLRAAASRNVPILIQEQNSYAGITNKLLAKKASSICVAYDGMERFFPAGKILLTGNPVRQDLNNVEEKKTEAHHYFKLDPAKTTLLVIGGSQGARTINESIDHGIERLIKKDIQVIWQTGKAYGVKAAQRINGLKDRRLVSSEFITRMDLAYAAADIVVSRAGASSVSELCNTGKPCILVPSPNVAEDHQTRNALALVEKKAALLVRDADAHRELIDEVIKLCDHPATRESLRINIHRLAMPGSATIIAKEVLKLAGFNEGTRL